MTGTRFTRPTPIIPGKAGTQPAHLTHPHHFFVSHSFIDKKQSNRIIAPTIPRRTCHQYDKRKHITPKINRTTTTNVTIKNETKRRPQNANTGNAIIFRIPGIVSLLQTLGSGFDTKYFCQKFIKKSQPNATTQQTQLNIMYAVNSLYSNSGSIWSFTKSIMSE